MRLIDELNTFYNTSSRILDLKNGRLPPVHMVTKLSIALHQLPCNTSIVSGVLFKVAIYICYCAFHSWQVSGWPVVPIRP